MSSAAPGALAPPPPPVTDGRLRAGRHRRYALAATLGAMGLGALLFWATAVGAGETADAATALPSAGRIVEWGLPLVTLAGRIAAVGTVGTLLFAAVLLPGRDGALPAESRRALRAASIWALTWTAATALGAVLTLSRLLGTSPTSVSWASLQVFLEDTGAGRAALLGTTLGLTLFVAARRCTRATGARILLAVASAAVLLPVALAGHSAASEDHLLAVTTLGIHVVAATVWVGGLLALLVHGRGRAATTTAAPRFSRLALVCFLATAVSGVVAAVLVLGGTGAVLPALGTGYGALLVAKTAGLTAIGLLGRQHRRRTLPRLRAGDGRGFRRFAAGEVGLMLATVTLAVALAASPPPAGGAPSGPATSAPAAETPVPDAAADPMAGHDHGDLSVGILVDDKRFHVARPVAAGSRVTVLNDSGGEVTLTSADGSFDVAVPAGTLSSFVAPQRPGEYPFTGRPSTSFADVLVVE
ncbi:CopD family protein [Candidatus Blastococcus massiliensis]|uniref:CopD family protein n=1 Tax=Candidatus Blastococcus massiliensis TaxID=1470358 RepID=UPI000685C4ED|nr:CopD family protein [Candidatus Blastococcus massiliensis]